MAIKLYYNKDIEESTKLLEDNTNNSDKVDTETPSQPPKASKWRKGLIMVSALVQQGVSVGLAFGLSVMYPELVIYFNELRSKAALIQGVYLGITCGAGILLTGLIKRIGPGPTIIAGSILAWIGFFASAFAKSLGTIIVMTGIIAGVGMSTCYLSSFVSVSWIFHEDPGFPLVCVTIGSSIGQFIVPILYELFISTYGWSGGFILVSGLALQCVPFGVIVYTSRQYYVTHDVKVTKSTSQPRSQSTLYIELLKDPLMWPLLFDFFLVALTGNVEAWFIVDIMMTRGFSREAGSILVSTLGFANFIGRVSGSTVRYKCTRVPTIYHWLWLCPLIAGGHALVINLTDFWALLFACLVQGATFGMNNSQTPVVMYEMSGMEKYPQAMSMVSLMYGFGNLLSNVLGGYIRDTFGQYDVAFYVAVGATLWIWFNTMIVSWFLRRRKKKYGHTERVPHGSSEYEVLE